VNVPLEVRVILILLLVLTHQKANVFDAKPWTYYGVGPDISNLVLVMYRGIETKAAVKLELISPPPLTSSQHYLRTLHNVAPLGLSCTGLVEPVDEGVFSPFRAHNIVLLVNENESNAPSQHRRLHKAIKGIIMPKTATEPLASLDLGLTNDGTEEIKMYIKGIVTLTGDRNPDGMIKEIERSLEDIPIPEQWAPYEADKRINNPVEIMKWTAEAYTDNDDKLVGSEDVTLLDLVVRHFGGKVPIYDYAGFLINIKDFALPGF